MAFNERFPDEHSAMMAIHLVTDTKKSFSALELQCQLGHNRYEPVWYMLQNFEVSWVKATQNSNLPGIMNMTTLFLRLVTRIKSLIRPVAGLRAGSVSWWPWPRFPLRTGFAEKVEKKVENVTADMIR